MEKNKQNGCGCGTTGTKTDDKSKTMTDKKSHPAQNNAGKAKK